MQSLVSSALACHPDSRCGALDSIAVHACRAQDGSLVLRYLLAGDIERLSIPAQRPSALADGLWQHTCCEAFVGVAGDPAYLEFNFSPSGEWAAYAFHRYRERDLAAVPAAAPRIGLRRAAGSLALEAVLPAGLLPAPGLAWLLGLSVVVEEADGRRSYWALHHPAARPDFHHRSAFVLELAPAAAGRGDVS